MHRRGGYSIRCLCARYEVSRQSYYQHVGRQHRRNQDEEQILTLVRQRRACLTYEGGRKLWQYLQPLLAERGLSIGRDRLFDLLRREGLLVQRKRRRAVTTQSRHAFRTYTNLAADLSITSTHQLWVADITYLRTAEGFHYLALITDAHSRKIVGYDVSNSLELQGCCRALDMALKQLPEGAQPVHHSDRGIQYCSHTYTVKLREHGLDISMASRGNCYENALAERMNGILKEEFLLNHTFRDTRQVREAVRQAVKLYNQVRLHMELDYQTPDHVHKNPT